MADATHADDPVPRQDGGPAGMIRLAAAMAVQDAVSHMRNTYTIAEAAIGLAQAMLLREESVQLANDTIAASNGAIAAAAENFAAVSAATADLLEKFASEP